MDLENIIPKAGPAISEVRKYIDKYNNEIIVIKCGGSVLLDSKLFNQFIEDISVINKLGLKIIVVHGGGKNIQKKLDENKIESKFIDGLRITDEKVIKIVENSLNELNAEIVKKLNEKKCIAISINSKKNVIKVDKISNKLGYVGNPKEVDHNNIKKLLSNKKLPVIVPMGNCDDNKIYNINADTAAGSIAKSLSSRRLLLMTDVEGVLDNNKKLIPQLNSNFAKKMIDEGIIQGGMIPKINTCLDSLNNGVTGVAIVDGRKSHSILFELFSDKGSGTLIRK
jgi:acetylglutamate kinase